MAVQLWSIGLVLLGCVVGSFGPIFLKRSSETFGLSFKGLFRNKDLVIGILFYAFGTIVFIPALKGGDLSVLYPLVATSYIFVSLYSIKLLKERMNKYKWVGILLIMLGVAFIGLGS